ncbi:MAG TPA: hypothetical protein ENF87_00895 [Thermoproteales archaeon]|nr:hypothetical protein [Thermoproteales archaeon]
MRDLLRVLKAFGERDKYSLWELSLKTGLPLLAVKKAIEKLVENGYAISDKGFYKLTERGKLLLEVAENLDRRGEPYIFTTETGNPVPLSVNSLIQLYAIIKYGLVDKEIFKDHVTKGFLGQWLKTVMKSPRLAEKFEKTVEKGEDFSFILSLLEFLMGDSL